MNCNSDNMFPVQSNQDKVYHKSIILAAFCSLTLNNFTYDIPYWAQNSCIWYKNVTEIELLHTQSANNICNSTQCYLFTPIRKNAYE